MRNLVLENSFVRKLCCCLFNSRCELCGSRVRLGRNILIGRSTWAVLPDTKHRDDEKYPKKHHQTKAMFYFFVASPPKKKVILAVPRKQLSMWETQNFPHFFVFCLGGRLNICCWVHPLKWLIISVEPLLNTVQFGELGSSS